MEPARRDRRDLLSAWHRLDGDRLVLELHVQPGAARTEVAGLYGGRLKLRLAARAVDGKANAALIEFIAERLGAARRDVTIEAGLSARQADFGSWREAGAAGAI